MTSQWTELIWVDLLGRAHAVRRRTADLDTPITVARGYASAGFGALSAVAEAGTVLLRPDLGTIVENVFDADCQLVMADVLEASGQPSPLCGRSALRRVLTVAADRGYEVSTAVELECYLLDPSTRLPVYDVTDCYGMTRSDQYESVLAPLRNDLPRMGIAIEASNLEYSGGQFEVNIRYGDALQAADRGVLLRLLLGRVAEAAGFHATFMAKPWTTQAGSGLHIHQSLWRDGVNVFASPDGGLSDLGHYYVAGLLAHMAPLTLLGSPTVNAYHRRSDGSFAPTVGAWGSDNRTVAIRAVIGSAAATRIEQRDAAADCNIYLAMAGQIAAGLRGLDGDIPLPPAVEGNAYAQADLPRLPRTFLEAYEALQNSAAAREFLGAGLIEAYLSALRPEIDVFLGSCAQWEIDRYMEPCSPPPASVVGAGTPSPRDAVLA